MQVGGKYGMSSHDLQVFIATDTPPFFAVFREATKKIGPRSKVVAMNTNNIAHFLESKSHSSQVQMHVENTVLGDVQEIVAFRSGFSQATKCRRKTAGLNQVYNIFCPHR